MEGSPGNNHVNDGGTGKKTTGTFPKTKLKRIMCHALQRHPQAEIEEDARDAVDRCTLEFAVLVTTVAAEECHKDRRKIINGDDLINAMEILGFDHYVGPLNEYLLRYRDSKGQPPCDVMDTSNVPATTVVMQEPTPPPQPFGLVLDQQPLCDVTVHIDAYAVWSMAAEASTSSLTPTTGAD